MSGGGAKIGQIETPNLLNFSGRCPLALASYRIKSGMTTACEGGLLNRQGVSKRIISLCVWPVAAYHYSVKGWRGLGRSGTGEATSYTNKSHKDVAIKTRFTILCTIPSALAFCDGVAVLLIG